MSPSALCSRGQGALAKQPPFSWGPGPGPAYSWVAGFSSLPALRFVQMTPSHPPVGAIPPYCYYRACLSSLCSFTLFPSAPPMWPHGAASPSWGCEYTWLINCCCSPLSRVGVTLWTIPITLECHCCNNIPSSSALCHGRMGKINLKTHFCWTVKIWPSHKCSGGAILGSVCSVDRRDMWRKWTYQIPLQGWLSSLSDSKACPKYSAHVLIYQRRETYLNIKHKVLEIQPECLSEKYHTPYFSISKSLQKATSTGKKKRFISLAHWYHGNSLLITNAGVSPQWAWRLVRTLTIDNPGSVTYAQSHR